MQAKLRETKLKSAVKSTTLKYFEEKYPDEQATLKSGISKVIEDLEYKILREAIIKENKRSDGRKTDQIRPIECEVGVLSRTHGSALFTRG